MNFSDMIQLSLPNLAILFVVELASLHILSQRLTQTMYNFFVSLFHSRTIAITVLTILLFPGTVVHELAHLFTAEILGVRTGKLTLVPESLEGTEIKAGAVMIAETDPLRRTLIGVAPVIWGIVTLAALSYWLPSLWQQTITAMNEGNTFTDYSSYALLLVLYALFAISNSMFSSSEDMKGVIPFMITVVLFGAAGYFAGFRLGFTDALLAGWNPVVQTLVRSLGIVLMVNLVVLLIASGLLALLSPRKR